MGAPPCPYHRLALRRGSRTFPVRLCGVDEEDVARPSTDVWPVVALRDHSRGGCGAEYSRESRFRGELTDPQVLAHPHAPGAARPGCRGWGAPQTAAGAEDTAGSGAWPQRFSSPQVRGEVGTGSPRGGRRDWRGRDKAADDRLLLGELQ